MHLAILLFLAVSLSVCRGCGLDLGDKDRGEPCTSDRDCDREDGLVCRAGTCDYPADAAPGDAS